MDPSTFGVGQYYLEEYCPDEYRLPLVWTPQLLEVGSTRQGRLPPKVELISLKTHVLRRVSADV